MGDMENLNASDHKTILFSLMIFFGLGLVAVLLFSYFSLAVFLHPIKGTLNLIEGAIVTNLIPATYPILYGMALGLAFINFKKNQMVKAIKCQFLPLISIGLFFIFLIVAWSLSVIWS